MNTPPRLRFSKMQGAGNDFVILDWRAQPARLDPTLAARLADRHFGVGCDQVITIEAPISIDALARYGIWNADGSASQQCGNGARCVARWLQREGVAGEARFRLDSPSGTVEAELRADGSVAIQMGVPDFAPSAIGLRGAVETDPYALEFAPDEFAQPGLAGAPPKACVFGAVSIGNPHAVLEVEDAASAEVARIGSMLQQAPFFGAGCNVGFAQVLASDRIRLRVYERGVGETLACGSGACAAVAILARRSRVARDVSVELPGGNLQISWAGVGHPIWMAGPAEFVFEGEFIV